MDKRQRAYYTKGQINTGLETDGGEWMLIDGTEYICLLYTSPSPRD